MQIFFDLLLGIGVLVGVVFSALVLITSKGDAMSGGGSSVRTSFKGKASIDDQMSRVLLILGVAFLAIMLLLDFAGNHITR